MSSNGKAIRPRDAGPDIAWMSRGACIDWGDLPWIADPEQTTACDRLAMAGLCHDCPVFSDCAGYALREKVTAGFWAGKPRDSDTPRVMAGQGWAIDPLPGLGGLGGVA